MLMIAPLTDSRGIIRYFIGAQVDVSGLVKECSDLDSLRRLAHPASDVDGLADSSKTDAGAGEKMKDEFQELSEMLNLSELDTVRKWGGRMHKNSYERPDSTTPQGNWNKPRLVINSLSPSIDRIAGGGDGRLSGIYEHYLLVRPYPNLRILFASPTLRVPGILQSPFMNKIGGSSRVRDELTQALANGRGVTAKVRWITKLDPEGRGRWIHCTPLIGSNGLIGVWMIVLVDDEERVKHHRQAPAIDPEFGRSIPCSPRDYGNTYRETENNGGQSSMRSRSRTSNSTSRDRNGSPDTVRI